MVCAGMGTPLAESTTLMCGQVIDHVWPRMGGCMPALSMPVCYFKTSLSANEYSGRRVLLVVSCLDSTL